MALIEIEHLTKRYGSTVALADINLKIEKGQIVGLLGPNGAGKTTLIKLLSGLLAKDFGEIRIDGKEIGVETKKMVSYLPDKLALPEKFRVSELVKLYEDFFEDFNRTRAEAMIKDLDLSMGMLLSDMSKGTKEKIQLILTMARGAKVYLLDEPIGGVDPAAREYILKTILNNYNPEAVVLISTHLIADVESVLDDIIFVKDRGILLHAPAEELRMTRHMSIDELFR